MSIKARALWAVLIFFVVGGSLLAQEKKGETQGSASSSPQAATAPSPHNYVISPEDAARKNPIKFTDASVNRGKRVFATQCALCHGEKGDGKSDLAKEMALTLPDFTQSGSLAKRTDGELFAIVANGKDPMPGQKGRMPDPQIWNLVNYLRSLGGKAPSKATAKEASDENVILVPQ